MARSSGLGLAYGPCEYHYLYGRHHLHVRQKGADKISGAGLMVLLNRQTPVATIIGFLVLLGMGVGCAFQPTLVALQANSPKSRRAVVISTRNFFRCSGGSFGLAASAAVLQAALRSSLPPDYSYLANNTYSLPKFQGSGFDAVLDAYMAASRAVFILQIPLVGACLVGCLFIKDRGLEPMEDKIAADVEATTEKSRPRSEKDAPSSNTVETVEAPAIPQEAKLGRREGILQ